MKKVFSPLVLCILSVFFTYAQEPPKLPEVIPPSPTAFELGKFGEIPVGMFNGTPNVSIPLYTYSTKNMSVPISLSYSNPGIRVQQVSGWAGLGWNLNAGGVITRMAKGIADETYGGSLDFPDAAMNDFINSNNHLHPDATEFIYEMAGANKDGEHDVYNFNFNGNTGQFVIDGQGRIVLLSNTAPVRVKADGYGTGKKFYITTPDGITYEFAATELTRNTNECVTSAPDNRAISAWYLSKMTHPFGDVITFEYAPVSYTYIAGKSQSYSKSLGKGIGDCACPEDSYSNCNQYIELSGQKLVKISSGSPVNGELRFNAELEHPEISNYPLLENLQVVDRNNDIIEKFDFTYSFTTHKRVFLDKLTMKNPAQEYTFEYINKANLPVRSSYACDHWGFYNGKNTNNTLLIRPNSAIWNNVTNLIGANREPDAKYTPTGLLSKVIYPTSGATELTYEPNTFYGGKTSYTDNIYQVNSNPQSPSLSSTIQFTTGNNYQNTALYPTRITGYEDLDNTLCSGCSGDALITLTDLSNNQVIASGTVTPGQSIDLSVTLAKNRSYELKVVNTGTLHYLAQLRYFDAATVTANHTGPGMRIKQTRAIDPVNQKEILKNYYYAQKDNLSVSSGTNYRAPVYESPTMSGVPCSSVSSGSVGCGMKFCYYSNLSSNSVSSLVDQRSGMIFYPHVTVSLGGAGFETGMETHEFIVHQLDANRQVWGSGEYSSASTILLNQDAADNGLEKKTVFYLKNPNNTYTRLYEKENQYTKDTVFDYAISNYITTRLYQPRCEAVWPDYSCTAEDTAKSYPYIECTTAHQHFWKPINGLRCVAEGNNNQVSYTYHPCYGRPVNTVIQVGHFTISGNPLPIDMLQYDHVSERYALTQTTERTYDENGQNPVERITNYYYDNPEHLQLTRTEVTDSKGDTLLARVYYPDDLATLSGLTTVQQNAIKKLNLNDQHRVSLPIQTENYQNGTLLSSQRTLYKDWGNAIVLPEVIQTKKGSTASFENRIQFHSYDTQGNPLEVSQTDGSRISYLWGYQGKYPVAKIANATYNQATAPVTGLNLTILENPTDDAQLRSELQKLRSALPDAMVTTYTYQPLIGATGTTDPGGYTTHYGYDIYNRLKDIKDNDTFLQQEYRYHYKGETTTPGQGLSLGSITGPQNRFEGESGNYTIGVLNGSGDYTISWQLEKPDGSTTALQTETSVSYTFDNTFIGTNILRCTVTDNQSSAQQQAALSITVNSPQVISGISTANPWLLTGTPVNFSISAGGGSGNFSYQWTFNSPGDTPVTTTGASVNPTFPASFNDMISVNCEVTDTGLGNKIFKSLAVQGYTLVTQNPISGVEQAGAGETLNFTANAAGGSGSYQYNWSFSPAEVTVSNSTSQEVTAVLNPGFSGTLTVTSTLTDTVTGSTATQTKNVTVYAALNTGNITAGLPVINASAGTADYDFTINPGGGSGSYSYSWYVDNVPQASATGVLSYQLSCGETKAIKCVVTDTATNATATQIQNFSFNDPSVCN